MDEIITGGGFAWLPWRVAWTVTEELGKGLGIWLGSIFDAPATGAPVWPIVVMDWFGNGGGGMPYILGGCAVPGTDGGGAT